LRRRSALENGTIVVLLVGIRPPLPFATVCIPLHQIATSIRLPSRLANDDRNRRYSRMSYWRILTQGFTCRQLLSGSEFRYCAPMSPTFNYSRDGRRCVSTASSCISKTARSQPQMSPLISNSSTIQSVDTHMSVASARTLSRQPHAVPRSVRTNLGTSEVLIAALHRDRNAGKTT
jgi:hypothetical protein